MDKPEPRPTGSQWDIYAEQARLRLQALLPAAPEEVLSGYVRWVPWIAIIFGAIEAILLLFGGLFQAFSFGAVIVGLAASAVMIMGGNLMLKNSLTGWWLLAAAISLSILRGLFSLPLGLFAMLLGLVVAYIHLLVKPRYIAS